MFIILSLITIIAYLFNGKFGFISMILNSFIVLFSKCDNHLVKILKLIIISLPMEYIGIFGVNMYQIISWYNIFLLLYIYSILKYYKKLTTKSLLSIVSVFLLLIVQLIWISDIPQTMIEITQVLIMIIPIILTFDCKEELPINLKQINKLLHLYVDVCIATSIGMIVQYFLHYYLHIDAGFILYTGHSRISFFCLFKGASILPIYMGIGFLILFIDFFDEKHIKITNIIKMLIIFIAMVLNTSRSGITSLFLIMGVIIVKNLYKKANLKTLLITILICGIALWGMNYIMTIRSGMNGFLDDNGRFTIIKNGLTIWYSSFRNMLFGTGFKNEIWKNEVTPHNVLIQTLSQNGIILTTMICVMIYIYLHKNKHNKYKLLIWYLLLSGMFVTDFYANSFSTVIFLLVDIYYVKNRWNQTKKGDNYD